MMKTSGALTSYPYAYIARQWEIRQWEFVDFMDISNPRIIINSGTRKVLDLEEENAPQGESLLRIGPAGMASWLLRWLSNKSRYSHDSLISNRASELAPRFAGGFGWALRFIIDSAMTIGITELMTLRKSRAFNGTADFYNKTFQTGFDLRRSDFWNYQLSAYKETEESGFNLWTLWIMIPSFLRTAAPIYSRAVNLAWRLGETASFSIGEFLQLNSSTIHLGGGYSYLNILGQNISSTGQSSYLQSMGIGLCSLGSLGARNSTFLRFRSRFLFSRFHIPVLATARPFTVFGTTNSIAYAFLGIMGSARSILRDTTSSYKQVFNYFSSNTKPLIGLPSFLQTRMLPEVGVSHIPNQEVNRIIPFLTPYELGYESFLLSVNGQSKSCVGQLTGFDNADSVNMLGRLATLSSLRPALSFLLFFIPVLDLASLIEVFDFSLNLFKLNINFFYIGDILTWVFEFLISFICLFVLYLALVYFFKFLIGYFNKKAKFNSTFFINKVNFEKQEDSEKIPNLNPSVLLNGGVGGGSPLGDDDARDKSSSKSNSDSDGASKSSKRDIDESLIKEMLNELKTEISGWGVTEWVFLIASVALLFMIGHEGGALYDIIQKQIYLWKRSYFVQDDEDLREAIRAVIREYFQRWKRS